MWTLRILNSPKKGACYPLSEGVNSIGRSSKCSITLDIPGISRVHAEIHTKPQISF